MNSSAQLGPEDFLRTLDAGGDGIVEHMRGISPAITETLVDLLYGKVYQRSALDLRSRFLISVAAVAACGDMAPQVAYQSKLALQNGVSFEELMEVLLQVSVFCGFARGVNAMKVVAAVRTSLAAASDAED
jgi:4-carboxymuconolactone decarboxylase